MSAWGTGDMAAALPDATTEQPAIEQGSEAPAAEKKADPQAYGWAAPTKYDYETFNKTNKELEEAQASVQPTENQAEFGGISSGDWANKGALYEWKEEYGDIGPRFPELEKQLFASEFHVRSGIKFDTLQEITVTQEGYGRIEPVKSFDDAGLHPAMRENVTLAGYNVPTPIQQYVLPAIFKGHDVVACAQTGSGKTAAFLIPILSKLMGKAKKLAAVRGNPALMREGERYRAEPLVLIVCPNRELATQIFDEARRFCYRTMLRPCVVYGGCPLREQIPLLEKGCDLLIATPGRLIDFINRPALLTLKRLKYMVIDEADEMLHSDWESDLKQIMSGGDQEEGNITYLMFSATFPKIARDLAKEHLAHDHVRIRVGRAGSSHVNIKQDVIFVEAHAKRTALFDLLMSAPPARTIIFVNSKRSADELDDFLFNSNIPCTSIHGDRTQKEREDSIRAFRSGKAPVLIATGVSARGLDIHNVMHVINYDMPSSNYGGIEEYTHRIGRTGRIGNLGLATSFYNERDSDIAETLVKTLLETHQVIPDFLEQYIPEGFTAEGTGDVEKLKFEADSDYGDGEGENGENGEAPAEGVDAGGWGAPAAPEASGSGWAASAAPAQEAPAASGWGAQPTAPVQAPPSNAGSNWGQQPTPAPQGPPAEQSGWGSAPQGFQGPPAQGPPAAQPSGWGAASQGPPAQGPPAQGPPAQGPPATQPSGWGAASQGFQGPPAQGPPATQPSGWGAAPAAPQPTQASGWGAQAPTPAAPVNNNNNSGWGPSPPGASGW
ncbi:P-loop containing nucleoside triphosphate hydrolase protein [Hyaloscypha finlandica]|nr:P-loop containing nucleoside triphosphate hydrolase protein [Hyaloscypha finlandica]